MTTLREINKLPIPDAVKVYTQELGFKVTAIAEKSKKAFNFGWNLPSYECDLTQWEKNPNLNIGVLLDKSHICTVDVDSKEDYELILSAIKDLLPTEKGFFADSPTARISSGKPNSAKMVFRVPAGVELDYHKLVWVQKNAEGKKESKTIFELRCGNKQDLLPCSIHPDIDPIAGTNYVYQWVGDEILDIPQDLLVLWMHWDKFEEFLKNLNPNKIEEETKTRAVKSSAWGDNDDYIEQWKSTQSLPEMLTRYGYKRIGNRFLSPNSHSGSAGIVLSADGSTFFSFGESDIFSDGHQHDCFDLMAGYEFGGDKRKAYDCIVDEMFSSENSLIKKMMAEKEAEKKQKEEEKKKKEEEIISKPLTEEKSEKKQVDEVARERPSDWLDRKKETVQYDGYPVFRNSPLYDLCLNFVQRAYRPRAVSAILSAVMFGSVICSRGYFFRGSQSKLYSILTASSGEGKNDCIKAIEHWAEDIRCPDMIMRVSKFSADSSVQRAIVKQPKSIVMIDEYGKVLAKSKSDAIGASANTQLTIQYTKDDYLYPSGYSDDMKASKKEEFVAKSEVCRVPALSLFGLGVPLDLESALTEENFETGEFSRYIMAFLTDAVCLPELEEDERLPQRCVRRIWQILSSMGEITPYANEVGQEIVKVQEEGNGFNQNPPMAIKNVVLRAYNEPPERINCYLEDGKITLSKLDEEYQIARLKTQDIIQKTLYSRRLEKIQRVAIIFELLNTPYDVDLNFNKIRHAGLMIHQKTLADAIKFIENSDNAMTRFEKSKKSYNSQVIQYAELIYKLLSRKDGMRLSRKDINSIFEKQGISKIHPSLWKNGGLEDCLAENYSVEVIVNPTKRGQPLKYYQVA